MDRLGGALLAAVCTSLTALAVPVALLAWGGYPRRGLGMPVLDLPFFVWVALLAVVAGAVGFAVGSSRTIDILSHLWGTATRVDRRLQRRLIVAGLLLGGATYAVMWWSA